MGGYPWAWVLDFAYAYGFLPSHFCVEEFHACSSGEFWHVGD